MAKLFVVSTPIGNLKDITLRAIETLKKVDFIACEDTRKTGQLLKKLAVSPRPELISFYEGNENKRIPQLIKLLRKNKEIALVSNAGTPLVSDPGFKLIRACLKDKIPVQAVPGPSACLTALVASGLPTDKFLFLGFLPKKQGKRKRLLENLFLLKNDFKMTVIFYESPYRLLKTLKDLRQIFGDTEVVTARELTKIYEEVRKEKLSGAIKRYEKKQPKGELTILFRLD